ncbi:MAG: DUF929 domain-containing protein [Thaumarchaeota archaeon]|nr:DUF929 domain-containing protein [Nitrososphaerota archaeon]
MPIILGLVVVTSVVGYLIYTQSVLGPTSTSGLINQPVSSDIMTAVTGVSTNTLSAVGQGPSGILSPSPAPSTSSGNLTLNGKPEVLYIGGEYCPYCAAERWAMLVAFSKFGNFTGVQYMQSSAGDVYASTSTFTFANANYSSKYITFVTVEYWDRNDQVKGALTSGQQALFSQFDSNQNIPFVDFGNKYLVMGAQYLPSALRVGDSAQGAPYNWTLIASQLNNSSNVIAQNVDGAANRMISAICKIDGAQPSSVCSGTFAQLLAFTRSSPASLDPQLLIADRPQASSPQPRLHLSSPARISSRT